MRLNLQLESPTTHDPRTLPILTKASTRPDVEEPILVSDFRYPSKYEAKNYKIYLKVYFAPYSNKAEFSQKMDNFSTLDCQFSC